MTRKEYKYFFGFLDTQEKWLNNMAKRGWRLVKTGKLSYEFESCHPMEYEYRVEFVADRSYKEAQKYQEFLEEFGYRTFIKNINLNYSWGKFRLRPYGEGAGLISTSPGSYNRELLILEKKRDGKPFNLHTNYGDLMNYYRPIRNAYVSLWLLMAFLIGGSWIPNLYMEPIHPAGRVVLGIMSIALLIPIMKYSSLIGKYKKRSRLNE